MKKLQLLTTIALVASALAAPVHAESETQVVVFNLHGIEGDSSNTEKVIVGPSNVNYPPDHNVGKAGIGAGYGMKSQSRVDFAGLAEEVPAALNGVHSLVFPYDGAPKSHDDFGVFQFVKVGTHDVWFGEWSQTGASNDPTRTVYYVGANADDSITRSDDRAVYTVTGINHYAALDSTVLRGEFTANFSALTLTGSMRTTNLPVNLHINIGTASITPEALIGNGRVVPSASISTSTIFLPYFNDVGGEINGRFYNGQADLAGMVTFAGMPAFDTAFGGTRN